MVLGVAAFVGLGALWWRDFHAEAMAQDLMDGVDVNKASERYERDDQKEGAQFTKGAQYLRQFCIH